MKLGFDDIAAAMYWALTPFKEKVQEALDEVEEGWGEVDFTATIAPMLISPDVPYHIIFSGVADVERYVRLVYHRSPDATTDSVTFETFWVVLEEAEERLRTTKARTIIEWNYVVDRRADLELVAAGGGDAAPQSSAKTARNSQRHRPIQSGRSSLLEGLPQLDAGMTYAGMGRLALAPAPAARGRLWPAFTTGANNATGLLVYAQRPADTATNETKRKRAPATSAADPLGDVPPSHKTRRSSTVNISSDALAQEAATVWVTAAKRTVVPKLRGQIVTGAFVYINDVLFEASRTVAAKVPQHHRSTRRKTSLFDNGSNNDEGRLLAAATDAPWRPPPPFSSPLAEHVVAAVVGSSTCGLQLCAFDLVGVLDSPASPVISATGGPSTQTRSQLLALERSPDNRYVVGGSVLGELSLFGFAVDTDPKREFGVRIVSGVSVTAHAGPVLQLSVFEVAESGNQFILSAGSTDGRLVLSVVSFPPLPADASSPVGTLQPVRSVIAHVGGITACAFHMSARCVVTAGSDHAVRLWGGSLVGEGRLLEQGTEADYLFADLTFNPLTDQLFGLNVRGALLVWDARTWQLQQTLRPGSNDRTLSWSSVHINPRGASVASLSGSVAVSLLPRYVTDNTVVKASDELAITAVEWASSKLIVTAAQTNLKLWDPRTGELVSAFDGAAPAPITVMKVEAARDRVLCGLDCGDIAVISLESGGVLRRLKDPERLRASNKSAAFGCTDHALLNATVTSVTSSVSFGFVPKRSLTQLAMISPLSPAVVSFAFAADDTNKLRWANVDEEHDTATAATLESLVLPDRIAAAPLADREHRVGAPCCLQAAPSNRKSVSCVWSVVHYAVFWEMPEEDQHEAPFIAVCCDLTPALKSPASPTVAYAVVQAPELVAVGDGGDISLIDIRGGRAYRRAAWSMMSCPAVALAYVPHTRWMVVLDGDQMVHTEDVSALVVPPPVPAGATAPDPPTVSNVAVTSMPVPFDCTKFGAVGLRRGGAPEGPHLLVPLPTKEIFAVNFVTGAIDGRLDLTNSSGAAWQVPAGTMMVMDGLERCKHPPAVDAASSGGGAAAHTTSSRRGEVPQGTGNSSSPITKGGTMRVKLLQTPILRGGLTSPRRAAISHYQSRTPDVTATAATMVPTTGNPTAQTPFPVHMPLRSGDDAEGSFPLPEPDTPFDHDHRAQPNHEQRQPHARTRMRRRAAALGTGAPRKRNHAVDDEDLLGALPSEAVQSLVRTAVIPGTRAPDAKVGGGFAERSRRTIPEFETAPQHWTVDVTPKKDDGTRSFGTLVASPRSRERRGGKTLAASPLEAVLAQHEGQRDNILLSVPDINMAIRRSFPAPHANRRLGSLLPKVTNTEEPTANTVEANAEVKEALLSSAGVQGHGGQRALATAASGAIPQGPWGDGNLPRHVALPTLQPAPSSHSTAAHSAARRSSAAVKLPALSL